MAEWKSASWKQEEDFSAPATELLARINAVEVPVLLRSTTRTVESYIDELLALEKRSRFGGDTLTTQRLAVEAVRILRVLGEYSKMLDLIAALFRKRGQMKQVQTAMVWEAARPLKLPGWQLPAAPIPSSGDAAKAAEVQKTDTSDATSEDAALSGAQRQELLSRLKFQCEGKIHLELEHARLCEQLAQIAEAEGRKREASDLLFGIQVETITNMPRLEKIQSVLSQLKLALENNDDGRVVVLSRKLNPRALGKDDTRRHKIDYFMLLAEYNERHKNWLVQARCWLEIYEALEARDAAAAKAGVATSEDAAAAGAAQKKEGADWKYPFTAVDALSNAVVLALVAGHVPAKELDDQQEFIAFNKSTAFTTRHHLLVQLAARKALQPELPQLALLVKRFLGGDLIREAAVPIVDEVTGSHSLLSGSEERKQALLARLCEHDLVVVSRFYRRVRIERLAELVGLTPARAEEFIMQLVDAGQLQAVFDRVLGVVAFDRKKANPTDVLEKWNARVEHTAALVERLAQLIAKERMLYAAVGAAPGSPVKA